MPNDFGKRFAVEECQKVSVWYLGGIVGDSHSIALNGQDIETTTSKCHFGGQRVWFFCPACRQRKGTLYRRPDTGYFACRACGNLSYLLQSRHRSIEEPVIKLMKNRRRVGQ